LPNLLAFLSGTAGASVDMRRGDLILGLLLKILAMFFIGDALIEVASDEELEIVPGDQLMASREADQICESKEVQIGMS